MTCLDGWQKGSGEVNLILLTIILSCVILLMLAFIALLLCVVKMQEKDIQDFYKPLTPPKVKEWYEDTYYERVR